MSNYSRALINAIGDVVVPPDQEEHERELAHTLFALLAVVIARLPASERQHLLEGIEDGALRQAIQQCPDAWNDCGRLN